MMIHFVLWKWRQKLSPNAYTANYVNAMVRMLHARYSAPFRVICLTDDPKGIICETFPLWTDLAYINNASGQHLPSCYRRLKIFDRATQHSLGIKDGDRIVSIDLDAVLINDVTHLFARNERFVGWKVPGTRHSEGSGNRIGVYNGSMFMFTAGDLDYIWHDFDAKNSPLRALFAGYMGSDQGWLSFKLVTEPFAGGWTAERDGVLSFMRNIQCRGKMARRIDPMTGKIVFFAGRAKPWHPEVLKQYPWIHNCVEARRELVA